MLMNKMLEIVQNGESWDSLREIDDLEDKKRLSISIAIITANRSKQLERCLNSIAGLVRPPEELIIVDSGDDSSTQEAIEKSQMAWPVQHLVCEQFGVSCARNLAVSAAKGEIIAFVDDDICVDPDWLERLERVFLRDPKIGIASGAILNLKCGERTGFQNTWE